jgi:O-antigen ligase
MPFERHLSGNNSAPAPVAPSLNGYSPVSNNPFLTAGYYLLVGYVFLAFSRVLDILLPGLRLPIVLYVTMSVMTFLSGCLFRFLTTSIGRWLFAFSLWLVVTVPFSSWRGGSAPFVVDTFRSFIFAAIIIGVTTDMSQVFRLIRMIAYSILIGALLSFVYGHLSYGRLVLAQGTFGDPNQYAMTLLFSLPFWLWIAKGLSFPLNLAPYLCMAPIFVAFLRAGSRGAAIGFMAFCAVLFWQAPLMRKIPLLIVMVTVLIGSLALLPAYLKQRYFTFFSADTAQATSDREREMMEGADVGSSQARMILLINSIKMTAQHPLFGVGAGQFSYQLWNQRRLLGLPTLFNETHNTYTQISSELGVPGLVIFLGILISSIRALQSVTRLRTSQLYRPPPKVLDKVLDTADSLLLALVVLCVCACFLSLAWGPLFFVVPAIIAVFHRAVQNALPSWRVASIRTPPPAAAVRRASARQTPTLGARGFGRVFDPR